MRAQIIEPAIENAFAAEVRFERERAHDVGCRREAFGAQDAERGDAGHHLRTVDECEPLFRAERDRRESRALERDVAAKTLAAIERLALTDQGQRHVGERRQIPTRSNRALARDDRRHPPLEHCNDKVDRLRLHSRMARAEGVRAKYAGRTDDRNPQRLARSSCVAAHEVELQRDGIGRVDRNAREPPKAGRHAVDRLAACEAPFDEIAGPRNALARGSRDANRCACGYRVNRLERQMVAVELDGVQSFDQSGRTGLPKGGPF